LSEKELSVFFQETLARNGKKIHTSWPGKEAINRGMAWCETLAGRPTLLTQLK
jgi:hypothetical protein